MRRILAMLGTGNEGIELIPLLQDHPELELALIFDADLEGARRRLAPLGPERAARAGQVLTDDPGAAAQLPGLVALIDARPDDAPAGLPNALAQGVPVVTPATARLLYSRQASTPERRQELLQALHEIVESVDLTRDSCELYSRILEVAVATTGAEGGSLMLLDTEEGMLRVAYAIGMEPEIQAKVRVAFGEGVAGRVAAEARPRIVRGQAAHEEFTGLRERSDLLCSLCLPLIHEGQVIGVLNLHHSRREDAFSEADFGFAEELGRLDAEIIFRAKDREQQRKAAARYEAVREVRSALSERAPFLDRLTLLCQRVAARAGNGVATLYLHDPDERELRLAATSLTGGGFAGEYRIQPGQGVDGRAAEGRAPVLLREGEGHLAYAALPLVAGERLLGVLTVQAGPAPPGAGADRVLEEILFEVAAATADEIADAERETRLAARATQMNAINETGIRLVSCRDVAEVLRLATSSAALIFAADHAVVRLRDDTTRRYVIRSYYGAADGSFQERLFRLDKRVSVDVLKRRQPLMMRSLDEEPDYRACETGIRSLLVAPLRQEGQLMGTLGLYEKVAPDRFYPGSFHEEDLRVFKRYVGYVERAVANARFQARTRQHRNFDDETGLPNANYLGRRIDQEVARAGGRPGALAVVLCRLENLAEIRSTLDPTRADRVLLRTAEILQQRLRAFDILARVGDAELAALLPDPGEDAEQHVSALARGVAEDLVSEEDLCAPLRPALAFGYAVYPEEGTDRRSLLATAWQARIRML
ncbi:MAG: GAF domain-containing protein [Myxococcota bacterium]